MRWEVFVLSESCDMRKSFDGLYGLIREMNPLTGSIFLFLSKNLNSLKKRTKNSYFL